MKVLLGSSDHEIVSTNSCNKLIWIRDLFVSSCVLLIIC